MEFLNIFRKKKEKKEKKKGIEKKEIKKEIVKKEKPEIKQPAVKPEKPKKVKKEDTGDAYRILIKPLVTEKATDLGAYGQYIFEVSTDANKIEVKKAIQSVYGVDPVKVNIISMRGKSRRYGRVQGRTKNWKKAVVFLKPGEKIEVYEGV